MIAFLLAVSMSLQGPGALQPGTGIVTGLVKTPDGRPAAGVRIAAVDIEDSAASNLLSVAETDSTGRYRLTNIPAGRYYIVAGRLNDLRYYPEGADRSRAAAIEVEPARIRADVNLSVPGGSQRPVQPTRGPLASFGALGPQEFAAYQRIHAEGNVDRKVTLLLEFERNFPKSAALPEVYVSLMNIYSGKNETRRAAEYAEKVIRTDPENVTALVQLSRTLTLAQLDPQKAIQYAEKAVTVAARLKNQAPPSHINPAEWKKWADSSFASAQSNLTWVKQIDAWRSDALFSLVNRRPAR